MLIDFEFACIQTPIRIVNFPFNNVALVDQVGPPVQTKHHRHPDTIECAKTLPI
jgi:hypothetical protein